MPLKLFKNRRVCGGLDFARVCAISCVAGRKIVRLKNCEISDRFYAYRADLPLLRLYQDLADRMKM